MASAQNKLSYVAVSDALLTQWEDRDLLDRDRKFGKGSKGKGTKGAKKGKGFSSITLEEEDLEEESCEPNHGTPHQQLPRWVMSCKHCTMDMLKDGRKPPLITQLL